MLFFFDETFRSSGKVQGVNFGALCGIAIPEEDFNEIAYDVYKLKLKHFGAEFAANHEIKGKELLKNWVFRLESSGTRSRNLDFSQDLLEYIRAKGLKVFGCVCFERDGQNFKAANAHSLDRTFRYLFERVDMFMKIKYPKGKAILVFDDRDQATNGKNAECITNFFQRSADGLAMDSIIPTPFYAISQAQSIGLQLADFVTTVVGLRFSSHPNSQKFFDALKPALFTFKNDDGTWNNSLKIIRTKK